jgi:hypothetical protein
MWNVFLSWLYTWHCISQYSLFLFNLCPVKNNCYLSAEMSYNSSLMYLSMRCDHCYLRIVIDRRQFSAFTLIAQSSERRTDSVVIAINYTVNNWIFLTTNQCVKLYLKCAQITWENTVFHILYSLYELYVYQIQQITLKIQKSVQKLN